MSGHLFLGGPAHLQRHKLPYGTPTHWDVPIWPKMPIVRYRAKDKLVPIEEVSTETFTYVPMRVRRGDPALVAPMEATVYVPAHLSEDDRWEVVKMHGLGQIPLG